MMGVHELVCVPGSFKARGPVYTPIIYYDPDHGTKTPPDASPKP